MRVSVGGGVSFPIAGSNVTPDFGAQDVKTTGNWYVGASPFPTVGTFRCGAGSFVVKQVVGGVNRGIIDATVGADVIFGDEPNVAGLIYRVGAAGTMFFQVGGSNQLNIVAAALQAAVPRHGLSTPYASEGTGTQAMANADQTPAAAVYSRAIIETTGAITANRNLTLPTPANEDASYFKPLINNCTGVFSVVVTLGAGATASILNGTKAMLWVRPGGVYLMAMAA